jgi:hypothetical protein
VPTARVFVSSIVCHWHRRSAWLERTQGFTEAGLRSRFWRGGGVASALAQEGFVHEEVRVLGSSTNTYPDRARAVAARRGDSPNGSSPVGPLAYGVVDSQDDADFRSAAINNVSYAD